MRRPSAEDDALDRLIANAAWLIRAVIHLMSMLIFSLATVAVGVVAQTAALVLDRGLESLLDGEIELGDLGLGQAIGGLLGMDFRQEEGFVGVNVS